MQIVGCNFSDSQSLSESLTPNNCGIFHEIMLLCLGLGTRLGWRSMGGMLMCHSSGANSVECCKQPADTNMAPFQVLSTVFSSIHPESWTWLFLGKHRLAAALLWVYSWFRDVWARVFMLVICIWGRTSCIRYPFEMFIYYPLERSSMFRWGFCGLWSTSTKRRLSVILGRERNLAVQSLTTWVSALNAGSFVSALIKNFDLQRLENYEVCMSQRREALKFTIRRWKPTKTVLWDIGWSHFQETTTVGIQTTDHSVEVSASANRNDPFFSFFFMSFFKSGLDDANLLWPLLDSKPYAIISSLARARWKGRPLGEVLQCQAAVNWGIQLVVMGYGHLAAERNPFQPNYWQIWQLIVASEFPVFSASPVFSPGHSRSHVSLQVDWHSTSRRGMVMRRNTKFRERFVAAFFDYRIHPYVGMTI